MDRPPEGLTPGDGRRPRDLALLLLAMGTDPPRARARDQQADRAGAELRRQVLDRLAVIDPEPDALEEALASVVAELGDPTGPTRGVCTLVLQEWEQVVHAPGAWGWMIGEALERSGRGEGTGRGRSRGAS